MANSMLSSTIREGHILLSSVSKTSSTGPVTRGRNTLRPGVRSKCRDHMPLRCSSWEGRVNADVRFERSRVFTGFMDHFWAQSSDDAAQGVGIPNLRSET